MGGARLKCSVIGPLAKKLCPVPGAATLSGLLVMRNEVSLVLEPESDLLVVSPYSY